MQAPNHYLNQWWLVYWHIYELLGLNELTNWGTVTARYVSKLGHDRVHTIACGILRYKPFHRLVMTYCRLDLGKNKVKFKIKTHLLLFNGVHLKCRLQNIGHSVPDSIYIKKSRRVESHKIQVMPSRTKPSPISGTTALCRVPPTGFDYIRLDSSQSSHLIDNRCVPSMLFGMLQPVKMTHFQPGPI